MNTPIRNEHVEALIGEGQDAVSQEEAPRDPQGDPRQEHETDVAEVVLEAVDPERRLQRGSRKKRSRRLTKRRLIDRSSVAVGVGIDQPCRVPLLLSLRRMMMVATLGATSLVRRDPRVLLQMVPDQSGFDGACHSARRDPSPGETLRHRSRWVRMPSRLNPYLQFNGDAAQSRAG